MKTQFILLILSSVLLLSCEQKSVEISGELLTWHKVTLTFDGPECSESGETNPFTDYRLEVTFEQGEKKFVVPGYFAADGQAAYTSAEGGNKWRTHFSPESEGAWNYTVSFLKGNDVAVTAGSGESAGYMDGLSGSFNVSQSDKTGRDFRSKGRLNYVGEHYQQFAETGEYFLKCGADAPENFLAFHEMDNTPNVGDRWKYYKDHAQDYDADADPFLWGSEKNKGKNILGAINYLSTKGMNAFSFLTFNVDGDDRNVFPYLLNTDLMTYQEHANVKKNTDCWEKFVIKDRFDVSKLDQWEQVFAYAEMKGMFLHFKTQENEVDQKMDGGELGRQRKLYYRELIARFGHHLALNWNIGEEITQTVPQVADLAKYIADTDAYHSLIVVHTYPNQHDKYYGALIGSASELTGLSIQTNKPDFSRVHQVTDTWVKASAKAGKKWVVAVDEPGDATHSLLPDEENPEHNNARINGLWGTFMAGGAGTEWYFGYKHAHSDLTCQTWRSRDLFWNQGKIALDFFYDNKIPFWEMECKDELTASEEDYVFCKEGEVYLIYAKNGGEVELTVPEDGFKGTWFNPRNGESIQIKDQHFDAQVKVQCTDNRDWLLLLRKI